MRKVAQEKTPRAPYGAQQGLVGVMVSMHFGKLNQPDSLVQISGRPACWS